MARLLHSRQTFAQQLFGGCDRGLPRPCREIPHQDADAARLEHPCDLGNRALVGEQMKSLGNEYCIHRGVREGDLLGGAAKDFNVGTDLSEQAPHGVLRLNHRHSVEDREEKASELASARSEIKHSRSRRQVWNAGYIRRPAGTALLIILRPTLTAPRW